jgi:hypothetical protein
VIDNVLQLLNAVSEMSGHMHVLLKQSNHLRMESNSRIQLHIVTLCISTQLDQILGLAVLGPQLAEAP